jgi:single-stranded DNA-binding protein
MRTFQPCELAMPRRCGRRYSRIAFTTLPPGNTHSNQWQDGETLFLRASVRGEAAKNAVASLSQGTRVVAHGVLKARSYETKNGEKRTVHELDIEELGISVRYNLVPRGFTNSEGFSGRNSSIDAAV